LFGVLLALVLGHRRQHVLHEQGVRIFTKLDGRALENASRRVDIAPQFEVSIKSARQARDIIDDDDMQVLPMLAKEPQHLVHAGPGRETSRHIVGKDLYDIIALIPCKFAAAGFLASEPVALLELLSGRNARVNHGLRGRFALIFLP